MKLPVLAIAAFALLGATAAAQTTPTASPKPAPSAMTSAAPAAPAASPSPSATPTATPAPTPKPFTIGGFADAGYTSVSGASAAAFTSGTTARVFDTVNQQPQFHALSLTAAVNTPLGGKLEVIAGDDADVINSYPKFGANSQFDITQAYLSYATGKFTLIGGKFETLAGAEVIESPNDMNHSRSILFGYAVPFTHTGARLTYAWTPQFSLIAGLNRGWDTTATISRNGDVNRLTTEYGLAWNPSKWFALTAQGYTGIVGPGDPLANVRRSLVDVVATYHATDALQFVVNVDTARQTNSALFTSAGTPTGTVGTGTWNGVAGYVNYAFSPKWAGTLRGETFRDANGLRTGLAQTWTEGTATLAYTPSTPLIFRLEARGDKSSQPAFVKTGGATNSLSTVGFEAIVKF